MVGFSRAARCAGLSLAMMICTGAALAAAAAPPPHYTLDLARSLLRFQFTQGGAANTGRFAKYTAEVLFSDANLAASKIDVMIDVASLDTGDKERDDTLKTPDLFDVKKFPQAHFVSTKIVAATAGRYEATGKLTVRNITKEVKVPMTFQTKTEQGKTVGYLTGRATIKRLDFGVGQGDWKATDQVPDEVGVTFSLRLTPVG